MSNENRHLSAEDAAEAMATVSEMQQAGARRARIPNWLPVLWATAVFAIFATIRMEGLNGGFYFLLAVIASVIVQYKLGVMQKTTTGMVAMIWSITALYLLCVYLFRAQGFGIAPYLGGALAFAAINLFSHRGTASAKNNEAG